MLLQQELAATAGPVPLLHPNLAEIYRQKVEQLQEALQDTAAGREAFELTRSLIDEIRLNPESGELRIEVRGELAGILSIAAEKKLGGLSAAELAEQTKMVAGARNCLDLLLTAEMTLPSGHRTLTPPV